VGESDISIGFISRIRGVGVYSTRLVESRNQHVTSANSPFLKMAILGLDDFSSKRPMGTNAAMTQRVKGANQSSGAFSFARLRSTVHLSPFAGSEPGLCPGLGSR